MVELYPGKPCLGDLILGVMCRHSRQVEPLEAEWAVMALLSGMDELGYTIVDSWVERAGYEGELPGSLAVSPMWHLVSGLYTESLNAIPQPDASVIVNSHNCFHNCKK